MGRRAQPEVIASARSQDSRTREDVLALLVLALVAGVYFVVRYGGRWAEADSGVLARAIRAVADSAQMAPVASGTYANGYGYQVVSTAVMAFTGLSVETLQQIVYPIVSAVLVLPAWALYRELTGSSRVATLATLLLLLVPEHLFAVLRGSHERLDRAFLLTALWLLVRSLRFRDDPTRFAVHVGLVLLATYGLIATNALFGTSLVAVLATSLIISWVARRGPKGVRQYAIDASRLLGWTSVAAALLLIIFVLFVYPPITETVRELSAIPGDLLNLILNGSAGADPYARVLAAWTSPLAYGFLSIWNYLMLGTSALVWLWLGWSWLRGGRPESIGIWMLWVLYAGFAAQGAASIASDRTGALYGNVQYRAFVVYVVMAVPLVAIALSRWRPRPWLRKVAMAAFAMAAVSALLKSTLDPGLSNKWMFYTAGEIGGLRWADAYQRGTITWVGPDDRLMAAYALAVGDTTGANSWVGFDSGAQSFLVSDVIRLQSARLGTALPSLESKNLLYDNGAVQLYRRPPLAASE